MLEFKYAQKQKDIELLKTKTSACPIEGLTTPRKCYYGSKYQCTWNELIDRCDADDSL